MWVDWPYTVLLLDKGAACRLLKKYIILIRLDHTVLKQTNVSEARFVRRYDEETKEVVAALEKR